MLIYLNLKGYVTF